MGEVTFCLEFFDGGEWRILCRLHRDQIVEVITGIAAAAPQYWLRVNVSPEGREEE